MQQNPPHVYVIGEKLCLNRGSNPGSFADRANILPLSYRATRLYHQQLFTLTLPGYIYFRLHVFFFLINTHETVIHNKCLLDAIHNVKISLVSNVTQRKMLDSFGDRNLNFSRHKTHVVEKIEIITTIVTQTFRKLYKSLLRLCIHRNEQCLYFLTTV